MRRVNYRELSMMQGNVMWRQWHFGLVLFISRDRMALSSKLCPNLMIVAGDEGYLHQSEP